jgi:PIN domain nuclease of toxin-antitoxin system
LAFFLDEPGGQMVQTAIEEGAACSAANYSEVAQKMLQAGRDWRIARSLLRSKNLRIEPVTVEDAEWAAQRWRAGESLSLADRLCLALATRLGGEALTADHNWGAAPPVRQIR